MWLVISYLHLYHGILCVKFYASVPLISIVSNSIAGVYFFFILTFMIVFVSFVCIAHTWNNMCKSYRLDIHSKNISCNEKVGLHKRSQMTHLPYENNGSLILGILSHVTSYGLRLSIYTFIVNIHIIFASGQLIL